MTTVLSVEAEQVVLGSWHGTEDDGVLRAGHALGGAMGSWSAAIGVVLYC